ncbi:MAG: tetratricopeptide repeat protein [Candidatus Kerfeldbacteria bacterium]|nr:tetratricopeptide repeat protein [Candidatus Kerfeldbacteria bacterium]
MPNLRVSQIFKRFPPDPGLVWENLARSAAVLALLVVPLLVAPWTEDAREIHKGIVFLGLVSLGWLFSFVAALQRRHHDWSWHWFDGLVVGLAVVTLLSGLWSLDRWISVAGLSGAVTETVPITIGLASWYFLLGHLFRQERQRIIAWLALATSLGLALLLQVFQLSRVPLLPSAISDHPLSSVLSASPTETALVAAVFGASLLFFWSRTAQGWQRWLIVAGVTVSWLVLLFIGQPLAWAFFSLGMIGVVFVESSRGQQSRFGLVGVAVALAAAGLVAQFSDLASWSSVPRPQEVRLDYPTTAAITVSALKYRPILGTGPNTWYDAFVRLRPTSANDTPWWSTRFLRGRLEWWQLATTTGVVGLIGWGALIGAASWLLWQRWRQRTEPLRLLAFFAVLALGLSGFFVAWSLVWVFLWWSVLGLSRPWWLAATPRSKPVGLGLLTSFIISSLILVLFWYPAVKTYASQIMTHRARILAAQAAPLPPVERLLQSARQLDQSNLDAATLLAHAAATKAELAFQANRQSDIEPAVRLAIEVMSEMIGRRASDPSSFEAYNNLLNRLSPFIADAETVAGQNFTALRQLEPASPIHDVGWGQTLMVSRRKLLASQPVDGSGPSQADELWRQALAAYDQALRKKPNYDQARLAKAQALSEGNQPQAAVDELQRVGPESRSIPLYWRALGTAESALKHDDQAVDAFQRALSLEAKDVLSYLAFSQHYRSREQLDQAKDVLRRGLEAIPNQPSLLEALDDLGG